MNLRYQTGRLIALILTFSMFCMGINFFIGVTYFGGSAEKVALENAVKKTVERQEVFRSLLNSSAAQLIAIREKLDFSNKIQSPEDLRKLGEAMFTSTQVHPNVMQFRYIDADGKEVIRVERTAEGADPYLRNQNELQDKSKRYYFTRSLDPMLWEKPWFTRIDSNIEFGKVEKPVKTTMRAVFPIENNGVFQGVLVLNLFMDSFIEKLARTPLYAMILCDASGRVVFAHEQEILWNEAGKSNTQLEDLLEGDSSRVLASEELKSERFFSRKLNLPIEGNLYMILKLRHSYAMAQKERIMEDLLYVSILTTVIFSVLAIALAIGFKRRLFNISEIERLHAINQREVTKYKALMELSADGIHILDGNGRLFECSDAFCEMLGYTKEDFGRLTTCDWDTQVSEENLEVQIERVLKQPAIFRTQYRRKDGSIFNVQVSAKGIELNGGKYLYASARDITKDVEHEREIEGLNQRLKQINESLSVFSHTTAHDLKNPLGSLIGSLNYIDEYLDIENDEAEKFIKIAIQSGERMDVLISDILASSKGQGDDSLRKEAINLNLVVNEVLKDLAHVIPTNAQIHVSKLPSIAGLKSEIYQLLQNLLSNALKYRKPEVTFELDVWPEEIRKNGEDFYCIHIKDNGLGIDKEILNSLFQPFYQGESSNDGEGIGLSTVKKIMDIYQGEVTVDSEINVGSIFSIFFRKT